MTNQMDALTRARVEFEYHLKQHEQRKADVAARRKALEAEKPKLEQMARRSSLTRNQEIDRQQVLARLAAWEADMREVEDDERMLKDGEKYVEQLRYELAVQEHKAAAWAKKTRFDEAIKHVKFPDTISDERDMLDIARPHFQRHEIALGVLKAASQNDGEAVLRGIEALGIKPEDFSGLFPLESQTTDKYGRHYNVITNKDGYTFVVNDATGGGDSGGGSGE